MAVRFECSHFTGQPIYFMMDDCLSIKVGGMGEIKYVYWAAKIKDIGQISATERALNARKTKKQKFFLHLL